MRDESHVSLIPPELENRSPLSSPIPLDNPFPCSFPSYASVTTMSLYADEDLGSVDHSIEPYFAASTSTAPIDPLQALAVAVACPSESTAQADALAAAERRFEERPEKLPELCVKLLPMVVADHVEVVDAGYGRFGCWKEYAESRHQVER